MTIPIKTGWQFHEAGKSDWHSATVPGCVHTDLLNNKLIEDPFYRDNEKNLQWIGKTDWEYQTTFQMAPQTLSRQNLELVFQGVDTYAIVTLNGTQILSADNMFRTWRIDVKKLLKPGDNILRVVFRSPINEILPLMTDAAGVFIMRQFFLTVHPSIEEAAKIDGAGIFRTYWSVVLPMARPALLTLMILSFQGSWNNFSMILVAHSSPSLDTLTTGVGRLVSGQLGAGSQYPLQLAAALAMTIPVAIIFFVFQKYIMRTGEGAIKE